MDQSYNEKLDHRVIKDIFVRFPTGANIFLTADERETNASFIRKCMQAWKTLLEANDDLEEREDFLYNMKNINNVQLGWGDIIIPYDEKKYIAFYEDAKYRGNIETESTLFFSPRIRPEVKVEPAAAADGLRKNNRSGKKRSLKKKKAVGKKKRSRKLINFHALLPL